ncbi:hypothetical protein B4113_0586 [Geobacillus sp. B4113_201601]|nr:hypothetical protein B4113_0586 [Geobacillus sp. B4113_201601]
MENHDDTGPETAGRSFGPEGGEAIRLGRFFPRLSTEK